MNQNTHPFRICDVPLPQCNKGFVYMLTSIRYLSFTYIEADFCIRTILQRHNSGYGSSSTDPAHLHPYALMAYICGLDRRRGLMFYVECVWKEKIDRLIRTGVNNSISWANCVKSLSLS